MELLFSLLCKPKILAMAIVLFIGMALAAGHTDNTTAGFIGYLILAGYASYGFWRVVFEETS